MTSFNFLLPESFDPREFLTSPALRCRLDDARYFISLILMKMARQDVDNGGAVRLHAPHLKNLMHQTYYARVVKALVDGEVVRRFPYCVGERSFGYLLGTRYRDDRHVRVPMTDRRLIRRLKAFHEQQKAAHLQRMKPVHHALARQQYRLQIRGAEARAILSRLPRESNPFDTQGVLVRDIETHNFHCNVGRYGRFSNNITNLKSELRETLHVGNSRLGHIDLRCAQPAFIAQLMRRSPDGEGQKATDNRKDRRIRRADSGSKYDSTIHAPVLYDSTSTSAVLGSDDFAHYESLVRSGEFYEFMVEQLDGSLSREVFKRRFLADVIAKRKANTNGAEYPSSVEDAFRRLFPTVYRFIRSVNQDGWEHGNLIRQLQRAESEFVIETVVADLVIRFPAMFCITLHDAIYTTPDHLCLVEEAFHRAFDMTGFSMTLKVAV